MAWVKFDDGYADHRKIAGLTDAAFRLHTAGILYCGHHLTDGFIEATEVPRLVRRFRKAALAELVERALWLPQADVGYVIHDYLQWNDTAEKVIKRREDAAKRKAAWLAAQGKDA